jgi:hypothetical protein
MIRQLALNMSQKSQNNKIIFGLKVHQLRMDKGLSFAVLAERTGMSVSYLNEIEKGKKFPKADKIQFLAQALNTTPADLQSTEMPQSLAPVEDLLQSNFLNELPLDLFGIEMTKVVEIIANAPMRVGAFISTLVELGRNYALREENFYFGALRSYLEMNNNYFEDLEEAVRDFVSQNHIAPEQVLSADFLAGLLEKRFGYCIIENGLDAYPDLKQVRSVFIPKNRHLLLNARLNDAQKAFQFGKELGFMRLGLTARAYTSSLMRVKTFDEALNHFKAGYFSAALLMNRETFIKDMRAFLEMPKWDGGALLTQLMQGYQATPEMLFQRMTNILPQFLGVKKLFLLRFIQNPTTNTFDINKELHLDRRHQPHGNGLNEHYCRRWISISLLQDLLKQQQEEPANTPASPQESDWAVSAHYAEGLIGIQRSRYIGTEDEYLCFTVARAADKRNISMTIGILIDAEARQKIKFLSDPTIPSRDVSTTCERCAVENCVERAIEPIVEIKREQRRRVNEVLRQILET